MISGALGCLWLVLASLVAMVPYPQHRPYALACLLVLPALLAALWVEAGWIWAALLFLGALSIYRLPAMFVLGALGRRLRRPR